MKNSSKLLYRQRSEGSRFHGILRRIQDHGSGNGTKDWRRIIEGGLRKACVKLTIPSCEEKRMTKNAKNRKPTMTDKGLVIGN